jgi:hypothetical protein
MDCQSDWGGTCSVEYIPGHAPRGAVVQAETDSHLTIVDQESLVEYDLWGVDTSPLGNGGVIVLQWGGHTYANSGDGRAWGTYGEGNAARVGNLAGRIRIEELSEAVASMSYINHALAVAVACTNGQGVYPAFAGNVDGACSARGISDANAPPLGPVFSSI